MHIFAVVHFSYKNPTQLRRKKRQISLLEIDTITTKIATVTDAYTPTSAWWPLISLRSIKGPIISHAMTPFIDSITKSALSRAKLKAPTASNSSILSSIQGKCTECHVYQHQLFNDYLNSGTLCWAIDRPTLTYWWLCCVAGKPSEVNW